MPPRIPARTRATIIHLSNNGFSPTAIANMIRVSRSSVYRWRRRTNLRDRPSRFVNRAIECRVLRLLRAGHSTRRVGRMVGVSHTTAWRIGRANGLWPYRGVRRVRLTTAQVQQRRAYIADLPRTQRGRARFARSLVFDCSYVQLEPLPNRQNYRVWARRGQGPAAGQRVFPRRSSPTKLHFAAAISYNGKSRLFWFLERGQGRGRGMFCLFCRPIRKLVCMRLVKFSDWLTSESDFLDCLILNMF